MGLDAFVRCLEEGRVSEPPLPMELLPDRPAFPRGLRGVPRQGGRRRGVDALEDRDHSQAACRLAGHGQLHTVVLSRPTRLEEDPAGGARTPFGPWQPTGERPTAALHSRIRRKAKRPCPFVPGSPPRPLSALAQSLTRKNVVCSCNREQRAGRCSGTDRRNDHGNTARRGLGARLDHVRGARCGARLPDGGPRRPSRRPRRR